MAGEDKRPRKSERPEIEFGAWLDAKEMRFGEVPETRVEFFGNPGYECEHGDRRRNLPAEVEEGRSYRNVAVDYRLTGRLAFDDEEDSPRGRPSDEEHPG